MHPYGDDDPGLMVCNCGYMYYCEHENRFCTNEEYICDEGGAWWERYFTECGELMCMCGCQGDESCPDCGCDYYGGAYYGADYDTSL